MQTYYRLLINKDLTQVGGRVSYSTLTVAIIPAWQKDITVIDRTEEEVVIGVAGVLSFRFL